MALKVIGAGMGRTGTLSLKAALEQLGFVKTYHMVELLAHPEHIAHWEDAVAGRPTDWDAIFAGYAAAVDYPAAGHWRALVARYPDAKVVLTERDPERWYDSVRNTLYTAKPTPWQALLTLLKLPFSTRQRQMVRIFQMNDRMVWKGEFEGRFADKDFAIARFLEHNAAVKAEVPADRLLVFQASQGWAPLCDFLGVPVPDAPYPRKNDRDAFNDRVKRGLADGFIGDASP